MNDGQVRQMNVIMVQAAEAARRKLRRKPATDLTPEWLSALEQLSSVFNESGLRFPPGTDVRQIKLLCHDKPWSYEQFLAFVAKRL